MFLKFETRVGLFTQFFNFENMDKAQEAIGKKHEGKRVEIALSEHQGDYNVFVNDNLIGYLTEVKFDTEIK